MAHSDTILSNETSLSAHARFLNRHGLYSAALFYKDQNETIERRAARAVRYDFEHLPLPAYRNGQRLMVSGTACVLDRIPADDPNDYGLTVNAEGKCRYDEDKLNRLYEDCTNSAERYIVDSVIGDCRLEGAPMVRSRYNHNGLHNVADFETVLHGGLSSLRRMAAERAVTLTDPKKRQFEEAMLDVIDGIGDFFGRYVAYLEETAASYTGDRERLNRLIRALHRVPMEPAETFYEAVIACNAVMFFDHNPEPGRIDQILYPYYEKDLAAGQITPDEAESLIRELLEWIDERTPHPGAGHATIGGTDQNGNAAYNALTGMVIRGIRGLRTPNVSLRVRDDMPDEIWEDYLYNIGHGCTQPAAVSEKLFLERLTADYGIPFADAVNYAFGGCSELLIGGKTMCDSTWVMYNMLDVFDSAFYNHFADSPTFETFYARVKEAYDRTLDEMAAEVNLRQHAVAIRRPEMLNSLFTDGCIDRGMSFTSGGARYNFDSTDLYGSTNAINALYTVKRFYDGAFGAMTKEELIRALADNFEGREDVLAACRSTPKFGNSDEEVNALAADLMDFVFGKIMSLTCWRGNPTYTGRYMPSIILWTDWIRCGERVGATPDGRRAGEPTADCCGPMQGTDTEGPTSVMGAALSIPQGKCAGTCVLNLRLDPGNFKTPDGRAKVRSLIATYFAAGGCQLQINVFDHDTLADARIHPERHRDIIVRVAGFSDYFVLLDERIQKEILKRTEHSV